MKDIYEKYESDVRSYCRKFPAQFVCSKDSYMYDDKGNSYLDFFCGAGSLNFGHNNSFIKNRVVEYIMNDGIVHSMDLHTKAKEEFIKFFQENILIPKGLDYKIMFAGPTGTNSNEAALKLARKVTGRNNIFALMGCFHGMSLGSLALTTERAARDAAGVELNNVTHIPAPYLFPDFDTISYMETLINDDHSGIERPAAVVIETVQAEGGVYPLPVKWLQDLRSFCDKYDILLIVDDIQTGCYRTGSFFSFERAGIVPDIVTLAKSIGGIGMPMALTLFKPELDIWNPGEHNGTFRGFQLAMVAGKAAQEFSLMNNIEAEVKRKERIVESFFEENLPTINTDLPYRGIGLIWGIDFSDYPRGTAKEISAECFNNKLVIELAGRDDCVLKLMPPLIVSDDELLSGLNTIIEAIKVILAK